ncbi:hypothetical protein KUTeg_006733 [Tegillarca granosa]|uniref:C-type lectin domain-containing protein n=1 Tax=Tegillarca granosa TaxID=220873 RepID=A0ABQ9FB63_TEGGR|nr:hypothetical protein KUTeg_006733 [Tegillarca granosa]
MYRFWLDGRDVESENHWYWDWNALPIQYSKWQSGQPDNRFDQDCLSFYTSGEWDDYGCNSRCHAICELEYTDTNGII